MIQANICFCNYESQSLLGPFVGGSDPHFPRVLEANPHFLRIFKILTFFAFSKSSLSSHFQNPHFPQIFQTSLFILTKVDTRDTRFFYEAIKQ